MTTRRPTAADRGDLAWSVATPPVTGVAGTPLPALEVAGRPATRELVLTGSGAPTEVEVVTTGADGTPQSRRLTVPADASTTVAVTGAHTVWLHRTGGRGEVRGAVVTTLTDDEGVLLAVLPLLDSALRAVRTDVLELPQ